MKKIYIQDVPREKLEGVVMAVGMEFIRHSNAIDNTFAALRHGAITDVELGKRLGTIGLSFTCVVGFIFENAGFICKRGGAK